MAVLKRAWALLSSRRLSVWLMTLVLAGYAVWVVPFQVYGVPAWRVRNIATGWVFELLGALLLVNTLACLAAQTRRALRRCRRGFGPASEALGSPAAITLTTPLDPVTAEERAARTLRRRGFHLGREGGVLRGHKGRFSPLGTLLSHAGIVLIAVSAILTAQTHFIGKIVLVEGESANAADRGAYAEPAARELAALPARVLPRGTIELVTVEPGFWRDVQLFNKLEARVLVDGRSAKIRINTPVAMGSSSVAIGGFGYAPEIRIQRPDGAVDPAFVKLKVFPPGTIDSFEIPDTPYRLEMKVYPDARVSGDEVVNRTFNLRDPAVVLRVRDITQTTTGTASAYQGTLRLGQAATFFGYTLRVPSIRYYAELRVVRNPGAPWFVAGIVLWLLGLLVRFGSRQRVVLVRAEADPGGSRVRVLATAEHWRHAFEASVTGALSVALEAEPASLPAEEASA